MPIPTKPYQPCAKLHEQPNGPGDQRSTAMRVLHDEGLLDGGLKGKILLVTGCSAGLGAHVLSTQQVSCVQPYQTAAILTACCRRRCLYDCSGLEGDRRRKGHQRHQVDFQEQWQTRTSLHGPFKIRQRPSRSTRLPQTKLKTTRPRRECRRHGPIPQQNHRRPRITNPYQPLRPLPPVPPVPAPQRPPRRLRNSKKKAQRLSSSRV